jgi:hypothetical protein
MTHLKLLSSAREKSPSERNWHLEQCRRGRSLSKEKQGRYRTFHRFPQRHQLVLCTSFISLGLFSHALDSSFTRVSLVGHTVGSHEPPTDILCMFAGLPRARFVSQALLNCAPLALFSFTISKSNVAAYIGNERNEENKYRCL